MKKDFENDFLDVRWSHSRWSRLDRDGPLPEGLGFKTECIEFVCNPCIFQLLRRAKGQNQGHQQTLHLDRIRGALLQHLFKQDAFMRDVLIDDPQAIPPGSYYEAVL